MKSDRQFFYFKVNINYAPCNIFCQTQCKHWQLLLIVNPYRRLELEKKQEWLYTSDNCYSYRWTLKVISGVASVYNSLQQNFNQGESIIQNIKKTNNTFRRINISLAYLLTFVNSLTYILISSALVLLILLIFIN